MFGFQWPWVSRNALNESERRCDAMLKEWNEAESRIGDANALSRAYGEQLNTANTKVTALRTRLARIAALETPNCAHIGKKMARIARGEAE